MVEGIGMQENRLWYRQPAKEWTDSLPLGNGRIGAMVFDGICEERIALNEDTLWSGYPQNKNNPQAAKFFPHARELAYEGKYGELTEYVEAHPPFQIDGNFAATAGIAEMFLQNGNGSIILLPALPDAWKNGYIKGLCAKDGIVVDLYFREGKMEKAAFRTNREEEKRITVRYGAKEYSLRLHRGEVLELNQWE